MSKSPLSIDATEGETLKYKQGWRALNRLLHKDKSFSGRERNCAFINCEEKGLLIILQLLDLIFLMMLELSLQLIGILTEIWIFG